MDTKQLILLVIDNYSKTHKQLPTDVKHPIHLIAQQTSYGGGIRPPLILNGEVTDAFVKAYDDDLNAYLSEPDKVVVSTTSTRREYHDELMAQYEETYALGLYYITGAEHYRTHIEALHSNKRNLKITYDFSKSIEHFGLIHRIPNRAAITALGFDFTYSAYLGTAGNTCVIRVISKYTSDLSIYRDRISGGLHASAKEMERVYAALESGYEAYYKNILEEHLC